MKRLVLILLLLSITICSNAQQTADSITITGKVVNEDGEPLISVAICISDGHKVIAGCVTDYDGLFSIQIPALDSYSISLKYTGYIQFDTTIYHTDNLEDLLFLLKPSRKLHEPVRICGGGHGNSLIDKLLSLPDTFFISGKILDEQSKQPIEHAVVTLKVNGKEIACTTSDFFGNYSIKYHRSITGFDVQVDASDKLTRVITGIKADGQVYLTKNIFLLDRFVTEMIVCRNRTVIRFFEPYTSPLNKTFYSEDIRHLAH